PCVVPTLSLLDLSCPRTSQRIAAVTSASTQCLGHGQAPTFCARLDPDHPRSHAAVRCQWRTPGTSVAQDRPSTRLGLPSCSPRSSPRRPCHPRAGTTGRARGWPSLHSEHVAARSLARLPTQMHTGRLREQTAPDCQHLVSHLHDLVLRVTLPLGGPQVEEVQQR